MWGESVLLLGEGKNGWRGEANTASPSGSGLASAPVLAGALPQTHEREEGEVEPVAYSSSRRVTEEHGMCKSRGVGYSPDTFFGWMIWNFSRWLTTFLSMRQRSKMFVRTPIS